jgi:hypothetical protein
MAHQTLLSGRNRRWPQILIELGSGNLNFNLESTTTLLSLLALQVGQPHEGDPLGAVHRIFKDLSFCQRLLDQPDQHLDIISPNYRETYYMETIITLILRVSFLGVGVSVESAKLLKKARSISYKWLTVLRLEIQSATDAETSRRCSHYAFCCALLC